MKQFLTEKEIKQAEALSRSCRTVRDVEATDAPEHIKLRASCFIKQREIDSQMTGRVEPHITF